MRSKRLVWILSFGACLPATALVIPAAAADADCAKCHAALVQKAVVHGAGQLGCTRCHEKLDASTTPHKSNGDLPHGLSARTPVLCEKCHEPQLFKGKIVHGPVAAGQCGTCHNPHASDSPGLLVKSPAATCLDCHADVAKKPHVIVGFTGRGHPLGDQRTVDDPARAGKIFACASCHEPHRSDQAALTRYGKGMTACQKCHNV